MPLNLTIVQGYILGALVDGEEKNVVELQRAVEYRLGKYGSIGAFMEQLYKLIDEKLIDQRSVDLQTPIRRPVKVFRLTEQGRAELQTSSAREIS